jgi:hypothetical protein
MQEKIGLVLQNNVENKKQFLLLLTWNAETRSTII